MSDIYIVGGCANLCMTFRDGVDGGGKVWANEGKGWQKWAGLNGSHRLGGDG